MEKTERTQKNEYQDNYLRAVKLGRKEDEMEDLGRRFREPQVLIGGEEEIKGLTAKTQELELSIGEETISAEDITEVPKEITQGGFNLNTCQIQSEALKLIPEATARRHNAMPLAITGSSLRVAVTDAGDVISLEALATLTRMRIEPVVALADEIQEAIDRNYESYGEIKMQFSRIAPPLQATEKVVSAEDVAEAPAVRGLDLLINEAIKNRASDIHIEPQKDKV